MPDRSQINCTDCHASDGAGSPAGPHGSIYPRLLKANYNINATTGLSDHSDATLATEYALCAQCHDMDEGAIIMVEIGILSTIMPEMECIML